MYNSHSIMKKLITSLAVLVLLMLPSQLIRGQNPNSHYLSAFSAAGGDAKNEKVFFSHTVGQVATASVGGNEEAYMNQGVQQVFCVPVFDTVRPVLCQFSEYDFGGFTGRVSTEQPGYYEDRYDGLTVDGCDSIVWIELTVNPVSFTELTDQAQDSYQWFGSDSYTMPGREGYHDFTHVYTMSDNYKDTLTNLYNCDSILTLHLSIMSRRPIPQIFAYQDKALLVNHKVDGYTDAKYAHYKWYRDGELLGDAADRDSYQPTSGVLKGCYYVMVPADDNESFWVKSNVICIGATGIDDVQLASLSLSLAPNPIASGHNLRISIDADDELMLHGAKILVYDIQGRKCVESDAKPENVIKADFASGVYSVHIILANGKHEARKLVVR